MYHFHRTIDSTHSWAITKHSSLHRRRRIIIIIYILCLMLTIGLGWGSYRFYLFYFDLQFCVFRYERKTESEQSARSEGDSERENGRKLCGTIVRWYAENAGSNTTVCHVTITQWHNSYRQEIYTDGDWATRKTKRKKKLKCCVLRNIQMLHIHIHINIDIFCRRARSCVYLFILLFDEGWDLNNWFLPINVYLAPG